MTQVKHFRCSHHTKPVFLADDCALQNFLQLSPTLMNLSARKTPNLPTWATITPNQTIVPWRKKKNPHKFSPNFLHCSHVFFFKLPTIFKLSLNKSNLPFWTVANQTTMPVCKLWAAALSQLYFEEKKWHPQLMIIVHVENID